jgi:hypothetical protein
MGWQHHDGAAIGLVQACMHLHRARTHSSGSALPVAVLGWGRGVVHSVTRSAAPPQPACTHLGQHVILQLLHVMPWGQHLVLILQKHKSAPGQQWVCDTWGVPAAAVAVSERTNAIESCVLMLVRALGRLPLCICDNGPTQVDGGTTTLTSWNSAICSWYRGYRLLY